MAARLGAAGERIDVVEALVWSVVCGWAAGLMSASPVRRTLAVASAMAVRDPLAKPREAVVDAGCRTREVFDEVIGAGYRAREAVEGALGAVRGRVEAGL